MKKNKEREILLLNRIVRGKNGFAAASENLITDLKINSIELSK